METVELPIDNLSIIYFKEFWNSSFNMLHYWYTLRFAKKSYWYISADTSDWRRYIILIFLILFLYTFGLKWMRVSFDVHCNMWEILDWKINLLFFDILFLLFKFCIDKFVTFYYWIHYWLFKINMDYRTPLWAAWQRAVSMSIFTWQYRSKVCFWSKIAQIGHYGVK